MSYSAISTSSEIDETYSSVIALRSFPKRDRYITIDSRMVIYSIDALAFMSQDVKQLRVKIFDELSKIVDPEINVTITELELIDEVDISEKNVKVDLHLTSPFCPAVFGFKICQDIHDNLLSVDGIDDVKVNVSNHFMAEQINNQVNNSPNPHKQVS
jgi:metal-sulfur cluster biosynthetic enzyme